MTDLSIIFALAGTIIFLSSYAYLARRLAPSHGYYNPLLFICLAMVFYLILIPWQLLLTHASAIAINIYTIKIDDRLFGNLFPMVILILPSFYLGYYVGEKLFGRKYETGNLNVAMPFGDKVAIAGLLLLFTMTAAFLCYFAASAHIMTYVDASKAAFTYPLVPISYNIAAVSGALLVPLLWLQVSIKSKCAALVIGTVLGIISVIFFTKTPLILEGLAVMYLVSRPFHNKAWLPALCLPLVVLIVPLLVLFTVLRYRPENMTVFLDSFYKDLKLFNLMESEQGGSFFTIAHTIYNTVYYKWGLTYLSDMALWVPKSLWPTRPSSIAENFAHSVIIDMREGQGFSFSPITEAYLNFGILGIIPHFVIFGLVIAALQSFLNWMQHLLKLSDLFIDSFTKIIVFFVIIMFFRGFFVGWCKMLLVMVFPPLIAIGIGRLYFTRRPVFKSNGQN